MKRQINYLYNYKEIEYDESLQRLIKKRKLKHYTNYTYHSFWIFFGLPLLFLRLLL
jgi:hypothetical protein